MEDEAWVEQLLTDQDRDENWRLFHENSKLSLYEAGLPNEVVQARMQEMSPSLTYEQFPAYALPAPNVELRLEFNKMAQQRVTPGGLKPRAMSIVELSTLLYFAYGVTRRDQTGVFPRPFRIIPSAGALYPLELYFHTIHVPELPPGLYHYNPSESNIRLLRTGDQGRGIAKALVQPNLAMDAAVHVFVTALFQRVTFKYKDRGYRFALLEAGHLAQNVNLCGLALGLSAFNIGGYFDRQMDAFLGLDGTRQSTVYFLALGRAVATDVLPNK